MRNFQIASLSVIPYLSSIPELSYPKIPGGYLSSHTRRYLFNVACWYQPKKLNYLVHTLLLVYDTSKYHREHTAYRSI